MQLDYEIGRRRSTLTGVTPAKAILAILVMGIAYSLFFLAIGIWAGFVDQPHPDYGPGHSWLTYRFIRSLGLAMQFTKPLLFSSAVSVAVDLLRRRPIDVCFFPSPGRLKTMMSCIYSRLILVVGILLIGGYVASTLIDQWSAEQMPCGMIWPPERAFLTVVWTWGAVWLAESIANRPRSAAIAAALFLILAIRIGLPMANGWVLE